MKIGIVIPSNNESNYVERLINFIENNTERINIEEIIIIESFDTKKIIKIAEKSHAKLYYNQKGEVADQMEIGAFEAKGEVIYFIKPGCLPPSNFDVRIIKYVKEKYALGCFENDRLRMQWNWLRTIYAFFGDLFAKDISKANSFFIMKRFAHQIDGADSYKDINALKEQIILKGYKTLL